MLNPYGDSLESRFTPTALLSRILKLVDHKDLTICPSPCCSYSEPLTRLALRNVGGKTYYVGADSLIARFKNEPVKPIGDIGS